MKGFPAPLLAKWPALADLPFEPDGPMAQAFARVPARLGVARHHQGLTAMGHLLLHRHPPSPVSPALPDNVLKWVAHLLRCGASLDQPFDRRRPATFLCPVTPRQLALRRPGSALLALLEDMGIHPMGDPVPAHAPFDARVRLPTVLEHHRLDWLERYLTDHAQPWEAPRLAMEVAAAWRRRPELAAQGLALCQAHGLEWTHEQSTPLWMLALDDPKGPWLDLAASRMAPTPPTPTWSAELGCKLWWSPCPGRARLRQVLAGLLSPAERLAWSPTLPELDETASEASRYHTLLSFRSDPARWSRLLGLVDWAADWGLPRNARTPEGLPWGLAILVHAYRQANGCSTHAAGLDLAWQCLERLAEGGHSLSLKPRGASARAHLEHLARGLSGKSVSEVLGYRWSLPNAMADWPDRLVRLRARNKLERGIAKRLAAATLDSTPAASRPAPRL